LINISHDYKVVITPYSYHHIIMKLIILRLDSLNKPSPMSEGVVEIRINSQLCKSINLTTRNTQTQRHQEWHDMTRKSGRVLPRSSVVFHTYVSVDTPCVARTLSHCTPVKRGKVSFNSLTHEATQFGIPYVSYALVHFKCLFIRTQPLRAIIDTGGGLPPWSSEFMI
jgi:hypothetical protein